MFSLLPRCQGRFWSAKSTLMSVAALSCWWSAITVPRPQVSDRRRVGGTVRNAAVTAVLVTLSGVARQVHARNEEWGPLLRRSRWYGA